MRTTILMFILAWMFMACDDDKTYTPDNAVVLAFEQKYPDAKLDEWKTRGTYSVAEFYQNGVEKEAWFDKSGNWFMTESDITFEAMPAPVRNAFESGEYKDWKREDIDMLERQGMATVYVIEVEKGKEEFDLYYTEDGTLVKIVADTDGGGNQPETILTQAMKDFIATHYAGAVIVESEKDKAGVEVDILHDGKHKEVLFDANGTWVLTTWEVLSSAVPANVMNVITTQYAGYHIDEVDYVERAAGDALYYFELEQGDQDLHVSVTVNGEIVQ